MLSDFRAPNLKKSRFRPKVPVVLNEEFIRLFRKTYPDIKLSDKEIREIIWMSGEVIKEKVIAKRDGVELPEQLGCLFIGSVAATKERNVDYKKSIELGKLVRHKNYETDGLTAKIFYTNFESSYRFKFHELWTFKAVRDFSRTVAKEYPERYTRYLRVDNFQKNIKCVQATAAKPGSRFLLNYILYPMKFTNGDIISRIRREVKAVRQDAFLTDRFLYSVIIKHASWLMRREDSGNKLLRIDTIVQPLDIVDLIEVDTVEAGCRGIKTGCTIMRTKDKLPEFFDGYSGPLIRNVTSMDSSEDISLTDSITYLNMTKQTSFKYNKTKYCWFLDGYLYFPNLVWDSVRIEGVFIGDTEGYSCKACKSCVPAQERLFNVPAYLHAELEAQVLKDLWAMFQIPTDTAEDKKHPARN